MAALARAIAIVSSIRARAFSTKLVVGENGRGIEAAGSDRETVERNVPDELAPTFQREIGDHAADHAAAFEFPREIVQESGRRETAEFADREPADIVELDHAGRNAVQADETETAQMRSAPKCWARNSSFPSPFCKVRMTVFSA